jgi:pyruvate formate lyase activating enzyme
MEIERDMPFYDQSGGGVTFTGGEPMLQREFLIEILRECKRHGIHTAVDTSGYTSWNGFASIYPLVDLFLYDLKVMDEIKHQRYTSVANKSILDNLVKLSNVGAHIIVRIPLIPGINDDEINLELTGSFLASLAHLEGVELMPYHEIGLAKYKGIGMEYKMEGINPPTKEQIEEVEEILATYHLPIIRRFPGRTL